VCLLSYVSFFFDRLRCFLLICVANFANAALHFLSLGAPPGSFVAVFGSFFGVVLPHVPSCFVLLPAVPAPTPLTPYASD